MKTFRIAVFVAVIAASVLSSAQHGAVRPLDLAIDQIMQARSAAGDFNGAVLVARQGHTLYERAFGLANLEWQIPNDLQTKFEIGSMTKQFTALLILQFVNEGRVHLDGHISDYLPYYRSAIGNRVTVTELLSHTSGIPNFLSNPGFLEGPASRTSYTVRDFVEKYCSRDLHFEPGTKFEYSNSGYFLLGAILEQVSGESYEQLLKERIFGPLSMKNSGYTHFETVLPHRAAGYERSELACGMPATTTCLSLFAAGALYSTVGDLIIVGSGALWGAPTSDTTSRSFVQT